MRAYEIEQTATACILWQGQARSETEALNAMAREAGYRDYAHCESVTGTDEGVVVHDVTDQLRACEEAAHHVDEAG